MDLKLNTTAIAARWCILVRTTRESQQCRHADQEKSCYTVNKVPPTKSRLDCGLLLSPTTTDYSRLLKIIKDPTCWFLNLHIHIHALDSNHFLLFIFLGLLIGRGKKNKFRRISRDRFTEKSADFVGIFRANVTENQSVKNGSFCKNFWANFTRNR